MMMSMLILAGVLFATVSASARSRRAKWTLWFLTGVSAGAALLAKGPYAVAILALVVIFFWRARFGRWLPPAGFIILAVAPPLVMAVSWALVCETRSPGFLKPLLDFQFGEGLRAHGKRIYLYFDQLAMWTTPWWLFAAGAAWSVARRIRRAGYDLYAVPAVVMAFGLAVFTLLPNKRAHYLLALLPMWALFIGGYLDRAAASRIGGKVARDNHVTEPPAPPGLFLWPLAVILALAVVGPVVVLVLWLLYRLEGALLVAVLCAVVAGASAAGFVSVLRGRAAAAVNLLIVSLIVTAAAFHPVTTRWVLPPDPDVAAMKRMAAAIPPGVPVGSYAVRTELLFFEMKRPVTFLEDANALRSFLKQPGRRYLILPSREVAAAAVSAAPLQSVGQWVIDGSELTLALAGR
jgi:4-amino-4-deoxy-L-arabinose transferase-like glycosyltransferase